jgi:hypothetical protein
LKRFFFFGRKANLLFFGTPEYRPSTIPSSCLTMAPRVDTVSIMNQTALQQANAPLQQARVPAANVRADNFVKPAPPSGAVGHVLRGDLMKENESGRVVNPARPMVPKDGSAMPAAVVKSGELEFISYFHRVLFHTRYKYEDDNIFRQFW